MIWWSLNTSVGELVVEMFFIKKCRSHQLKQQYVSPEPIFSPLGKASLAKQKILSIFHHVSNTHKFPSFTEFKECAHEEIDQARPWIKAGKVLVHIL